MNVEMVAEAALFPEKEFISEFRYSVAGYRGLQVHDSRLRPSQTLVSYTP